mgnify:CR=1 FL=1
MSLSALCRKLGLESDNSEQLVVALTHRSWVAEKGGQDNERLEFLGDAVLQLVVTDQIMASFSEAPEGQLSRIRSRLVRASALAELAHDWELGQFLRLGVGEERSGGRERESVLADACEAVIGAVYLVAGIDRCREVLGPTIQRRKNSARVSSIPRSFAVRVAIRAVVSSFAFLISANRAPSWA